MRPVRLKGMMMQVQNLVWRAGLPAAVLMSIFAGMGCGALASLALPKHVVSQKDREFRPGNLNIDRGETVQIVNDDGSFLHHAYIDSDQLKFDSGDQEPGSKTDIVFPGSGTFNVLCAIHPKMKLVVHVK
jgi:plastocyanin